MADILLVDDEPAHLEALEFVVKAWTRPPGSLGKRANGKEALEYLESHLVNLLITDLDMPGMGGLEMLWRRQVKGGLDDMTVVVLSANISEYEHHALAKLGVRHLVSKPYRLEEISALVQHILGEPPA